ncbi:3031_t:CDS:2 [Funneliformis mosseae]|uniref:3031_t:CDS:1 n=1 Tax=Funneliformis mosseae TaxID=27381 RepID=A0A9N9F8X1_FUNMO|nr:3031_t:CDS:2 [Funneliformis mosseae]
MGFGFKSDKEDDEEDNESVHSREQSVVEEIIEVLGSSATDIQQMQFKSDESDDNSIIDINDILLENLPSPFEELSLLSNYNSNSENFISEDSIINQDILEEVESEVNVNYPNKHVNLTKSSLSKSIEQE